MKDKINEILDGVLMILFMVMIIVGFYKPLAIIAFVAFIFLLLFVRFYFINFIFKKIDSKKETNSVGE